MQKPMANIYNKKMHQVFLLKVKVTKYINPKNDGMEKKMCKD
jgi:hypothetical protein